MNWNVGTSVEIKLVLELANKVVGNGVGNGMGAADESGVGDSEVGGRQRRWLKRRH